MSHLPDWVETEATVTSCRFQFARLHTLTLGIQTGEKFRIAFSYQAAGRPYSDEFQSRTAIPQGDRLPIAYNPLNPQQNSRNSSSARDRSSAPSSAPFPQIAVGIAGSLVLSLLWLALLRGCS